MSAFKDSIEYKTLISRICELQKEAKNKQAIIDKIRFINSHEVRKPVVNILGLISIIDSYEKDSTCFKSIITMLKESVDQLDMITRKIGGHLL
ncbi:hypothetical protein [Aquimarina sp. 2304DJ70-9]|uniref:hypothetical protein n=1 Tax=Aquimarina penaris TaxID=3231044 RepID=UPI003461CFD6